MLGNIVFKTVQIIHLVSVADLSLSALDNWS